MSTIDLLADDPAQRKARGAFFTPPALCRRVVGWAVRSPSDAVLEPSCGEAAFLLAAAERLADLGASTDQRDAQVHGVELHAESARRASSLLAAAGVRASITTSDLFALAPDGRYDAVIGNPPFVRYQDFTGPARHRSREAAARAGVALSALASSWAAFTVHASGFLRPGGRLGLVLPAELLSVNYAAAVRQFLLRSYREVHLVVFTERVFPGVLEEVVLLLADGYGEGPASWCDVLQARNVEDLPALPGPGEPWGHRWVPDPPSGKWTSSLLPPGAQAAFTSAVADERITTLQAWGDTTLGMVTGNNRWFAMSPAAAARTGLGPGDLLPLSPPGSRHLRGPALTTASWAALGEEGRATHLFRPAGAPSAAARRYIAAGEAAGVDRAYKCRVRTPWWRVPLLPPAQLLLTYMNAVSPSLCANTAGVHHLNSVHGVYLREGLVRSGVATLPLAALTSVTLLGAELVGRAYGGGMLKLEPTEADQLPVPAPETAAQLAPDLLAVRPAVAAALRAGELANAVELVDAVVLRRHFGMPDSAVHELRAARAALLARRLARGGGRGRPES